MMEYDIQTNDANDSMHFNKSESTSFKSNDQPWIIKIDQDTFSAANNISNDEDDNDTFTEKFVKHLDKLKEERDGIKTDDINNNDESSFNKSQLSRTNSSPISRSNNNKIYEKSRTKTPEIILKNTSDNEEEFYDGNNNQTFPTQVNHSSSNEKTILLPNICSLASTIGYDNGNNNNNNNNNDNIQQQNEDSSRNNNLTSCYLLPCSSPVLSRSTVSMNSDSGLTNLNSINQNNSLINPLTESLLNGSTVFPCSISQSNNHYSQLLVSDSDMNNNNLRSTTLTFSTPTIITASSGCVQNQNNGLVDQSASVQLNNLLNLTGVIGSPGQLNGQNQFHQYRTCNGQLASEVVFPNGTNNSNLQSDTVQLRLQGVSLTSNQANDMVFPSTINNGGQLIVTCPGDLRNQFQPNAGTAKLHEMINLSQSPYLTQKGTGEPIRVHMNPVASNGNNNQQQQSNKKPRISQTVLAAQALMDQQQHRNNNAAENKTSKKTTKQSKTPVKDVLVESNSFSNNMDFSNGNNMMNNNGSDSDDLSNYSFNLPPDADPSMIKLEKKRARNRVAARRCRERKMSLIQSLENEVAKLKDVMNKMQEQKERYINVISSSVHHLNVLAESVPQLRDEINRIPLMTSMDTLKFQNSTPNIKTDVSQLNNSFER